MPIIISRITVGPPQHTSIAKADSNATKHFYRQQDAYILKFKNLQIVYQQSNCPTIVPSPQPIRAYFLSKYPFNLKHTQHIFFMVYILNYSSP